MEGLNIYIRCAISYLVLFVDSFISFAKEATVKAAITAEETAKKLQNVVTEKV